MVRVVAADRVTRSLVVFCDYLLDKYGVVPGFIGIVEVGFRSPVFSTRQCIEGIKRSVVGRVEILNGIPVNFTDRFYISLLARSVMSPAAATTIESAAGVIWTPASTRRSS